MISDNGLAVGDAPPNPVILKAPSTLLAPKDIVISLLEYSNGTFGVIFQRGLKWFEATFNNSGKFIKTAQLTQLQLMDKEYLLTEDIDNDGLIGDVITEILDNSGLVGLFRTKSGALVIDEATLSIGSAVEIPTILKVGPRLFHPRTDPTQLLEYDDGSYGAIIENAAGWSEIKFSGTGMSSGTPTVLSTRQLVNKEIQFAKDIDKDGVIGDKVISVYVSTSTGPNGSHGMGLYGTKAGAIVIDEAFLDVGQATIDPTILKLGNALYKPKITNESKFWTPGALGIIGMSEIGNGEIEVLLSKSSNEFLVQSFQSETGLATGKMQTINKKNLLAREFYYDQDLNNDQIISLIGLSESPDNWA